MSLLLLSLLVQPPTTAPTVTFNKDIAPLLFKNCASCHRPGEVGPFPLLGYKDAAKRADHLASIVASRQMPPWKPEPGHGDFLDERRLTDEEIQLFRKWAEQGALEGDPKDLPPQPTFSDGWQLGEPDLILKMPEPFTVPATGRDVYQCFVLPTSVTTDRTVAAVEFRPGNRKVAHHALFFLDNTGQGRKLDAKDPAPGYRVFGGIGFLPTGSLGGWAPGATPQRLPEGLGKLLKKNSDLILQMHYHPSGKEELDQSQVGIYFTKKPAEKLVIGLPVLNRQVNIPPGEANHKMTASYTLPCDTDAIGVAPHMHYLGKEMKVTATLPGGEQRSLIWIKDWDFNWQGQYIFKAPVPLPKGTKIELVARYDNSDENPKNPSHPPKRVRWGEQTEDEMCIAFVQVVPKNRADALKMFAELGRGQLARGLKLFDRD